MIVYRLAKLQYIKDLSGEGARLYGGRWNLPGTACLYTSNNAALCLLEFIVQYTRGALPKDVAVAEIEIPNEFTIKTIDIDDMPLHWDKALVDQTIQNYGTKLLSDTSVGGFKIPSVVAPYEFNFIFNPLYVGFGQLKVLSVKGFKIDERL